MTSSNEPSSPAPPRSGRIRWLAPLGSGALLIYLISRVSSCGPVAPPETAQQVAPPSKAIVVDAGATVPGFDMRGRGNSFEFLGATKAAPMVIGDSLDEPPASEPPVEPQQVGQ